MGLSASADKEVTVTGVTTADLANIDLAAAVAVADAIRPDASRDTAAAAAAVTTSAAAAMMEAL